jgi:hypothetical protein
MKVKQIISIYEHDFIFNVVFSWNLMIILIISGIILSIKILWNFKIGFVVLLFISQFSFMDCNIGI